MVPATSMARPYYQPALLCLGSTRCRAAALGVGLTPARFRVLRLARDHVSAASESADLTRTFMPFHEFSPGILV
jgi:hypothetical protein